MRSDKKERGISSDMGFWHNGGFFYSVKGHVVKWWQQVILPVLHINNDQRKNKDNRQADPQLYSEKAENETLAVNNGIKQEGAAAIQNKQPDDLELARQKAKQMQREEEERRQREIERLKREADEQAQIASIMNANKVDVDAFIKAGKESRNAEAENRKKQEEMNRAQEIIDRLNKEAKEDEAKKLAEIEAAREKAKETFG